MNELVIIQKSVLDGIGDAVREQKGTTALIPTLQLRTEILSISDNPIIATTEAEMDSLMTDENLGKVIRYEGANGKYTNGELYLVSTDEVIEQYYILPTASNPASVADILAGKEAINENGELIVGEYVPYSLPELTDPATAGDVLKGKEAIDGQGNKIIGTLEQTAGGDTDVEDGIITKTITTYTNPRISTVGSCAFMYCSQLTTIDIANCTAISPSAFTNCTKLATVNTPKVKTIGQSAFANCTTLKSMNASQCTTVLNNAFASCTALSIFSGPNVTGLSAGAFQSCKALTEADFPKCTTLASSAFTGCSALTRASFPLVKQIPSQAFRGCISLVSTNFKSCTTVGVGAFSSCKTLKTLDLPVASMISASAFTGCSKLTTLILRSTACVKLSNTNAFATTPMSNSTYTGVFGSIYVPADLVETYKAATNWAAYSNRITAIV